MSGKSSKIEELYASLSKHDKESITSFLSCTLFNQSDIVISIHRYVSEHVKFDKELDKLALYRTVFGNKEKYSDVKLRVFLTKLVKLIEKFIVVKKIDEYPQAELTLLTRYYSKNHLSKNHSIYFNSKTDFKFESYEEYLMYDYAHAMRKLNFIYQEYSHDREKIGAQFDIVLNKQKDLSLFQSLNSQCDYMSFAQMYKTDRDNSFEQDQINKWMETIDEQNVLIKSYMLVYKYYKIPSDDIFLELKAILLEGGIPFESNHLALIVHAQNFCTRSINSGKSHYLLHLFELYQVNVKYYKKEGDLTSVRFRNIVFCALQLGKIEWAENFVASYSHLMPENDQENSYNFNYARIYFEKRDYKSAMRQLLKVTYEDSFYASTGRILLIKCYYELNDEMPLQSCCGSLAQFYNRSKEFTKQLVENNLHFIKYVKMLQKHRLERDRSYFKKLHQKVSESMVVQKEWLLKKIEELY
ncbi:MAG: tetratricopeptide repeat protein [Chitinophagales bacterium]|jgi:hypothetical protein|nr:hypothetical protein [Sphingobacteriales bacterium]